jgi:hypothetical protein
VTAIGKIIVRDDSALHTSNTEYTLELSSEVEKRTLYRMAKIHDFVAMWQGSLNQHATPKELQAPNKELTDVEYVSDTGEIINVS